MKKTFINLLIFFSVLVFSQSIFGIDTKASDNAELVPNVLSFKAVSGENHATLSWRNPEKYDFAGVKIQRSSDAYSKSVSDGENIYQGQGCSFIDTGLTNETTYYYTIFVFDSNENYSSGAIALAKPRPPSLSDPYGSLSAISEIIKKPLNEPLQKKDQIELTDFYYYLIFNKKPLKISLNDLKELHTTIGSSLLIEIPENIFAKEVNVITISTNESSYLMKLQPEQKKYQVIISPPSAKGSYELQFVTVYQDKTISDLKTKLLVDPAGYVYQRSSSFLGLGKKQEMRIENAEVTIFQKTDDNWQKWQADSYYQENPIITDKKGEYVFFVPDGEYYLEIEKWSYTKYKSDPFKVTGQLISKDIELRTRSFLGLILISFVIVLSIAIVCLKKYKNRNNKAN